MNNTMCLKLWNMYQSAWETIALDERPRLLEESVAPDILYTDPTSQTHGLDELVEHIGQFQSQFSGP